MQLRFLLIISLFASNEKEAITENSESNSILVKIEEDEYFKTNNSHYRYFGVTYIKINEMWRAERWSKNEKKHMNNGTYKDEEIAAHASDTLARKLFANGEKGHKLNFPDDDTEVYREKTSSDFNGVTYNNRGLTWRVQRHSKIENKKLYYGTYKNEKTAAHASDTLARKLIANGEKGHKLNFPDDDTEVNPKEKYSKYFGVTYNKKDEKWTAYRWGKKENKNLNYGSYKDEKTAARASDTLARELTANGEKGHKLNFHEGSTEVYPEEVPKSSSYTGVTYKQREEMWRAQRWSKTESKNFYNGYFKDEETAAHASDTLARQFIANGEKGHKLNFPDEITQMYPENQTNKRKRPANFDK